MATVTQASPRRSLVLTLKPLVYLTAKIKKGIVLRKMHSRNIQK